MGRSNYGPSNSETTYVYTLYGKRQKNVLISIIQSTSSNSSGRSPTTEKMKQVIILRLLMILCKVMKWGHEGKIPVLIFKVIAARSWALRRQAYCCVLHAPHICAEIVIYPRQEIAVVHTRCCTQPSSIPMLPGGCVPVRSR